MNKFKSVLLLACAALWLLAGCGKQQQFKALEQICTPQIDKAKAMQSAENVLGKMQFTIDKVDAEQGLIRTKPLTGAQFFEFWRSDNVGSFNTAEANLQSIRRTAELTISQEADQLCIACNVNVERLNIPQRQISSSSQAYEMFSKSKPSIQSLKLERQQKRAGTWVSLGKDIRLQTKILKRLEKQIQKLQKEKAI